VDVTQSAPDGDEGAGRSSERGASVGYEWAERADVRVGIRCEEAHRFVV